MTITSKNILLGGAAGQGLDTSANLLGKHLNRLGYQILLTKDYMSRIRGGHNFYQIKIDNQAVKAPQKTTDMLFCFNQETNELHFDKVNKGGIIAGEISDSKEIEIHQSDQESISLHLPWNQWATKIVENPRTLSTVALASMAYFLGLSENKLIELINQSFKESLVDINEKAVKTGYQRTKEAIKEHNLLTKIKESWLEPIENQDENEQILISGNEATGMSAIASGCKFFSTYPMTPSTGIMNYLAKKQKEANLVVEQSEDEIAGINKALGASSMGVRAMTATSGGGFSLMVESLGMSGVAEIPLVVANVQRPGPATGLPTRTEQADLQFVLTAAQGEFPRAVISLTSIEDAFYRVNKAFEIAEKYQIPVIVLSDQYLADSTASLSPFQFQKLNCHDYTINDQELARQKQQYGKYVRYEFNSESGISPRAYPGQYTGETVLIDSHEHDIYGNITEDSEIRTAMVDKRMRKLEKLKSEMSSPNYYGAENPKTILLSWGSTEGIIQEAVDNLRASGYSVGSLHFSDLFPFPDTTLPELVDKCKFISVENNATGQLAQLIARETGIQVSQKILRYDGRQITWEEICSQLKSLIKEDQ
ncbi:2-oxoacid:acceptor oxidoreductase subunit alpha [Natranaerobius thermophilus]|uniref:Pyruvate flavodoxin/ferredoxin oxidoreductase domain protein n=1 Tax=Natranaerobius thermophilus (strain ATCC BAA-1301 / DSM 18059 / JW/NM-WN-LF) TaxID=457570 RepID=B2A5R0_NATTJ|nr:2-oxoacid:acceptor oxidoreductase subunit alpha [Natranaerobius thermophilus]ACB84008.1 pyruvate flavodoxin/ferredoxin oxidoreductase domain protein [Natranaerobius thermophilus JW/NM-WN-LF]